MSLPATFAVIGDSLARSRRAIGFSVQSILKRAPIIVAPALGGWLLLHFGIIQGFQLGLIITIVLALSALWFQQKYYVEKPVERPPQPSGVKRTFQAFHPGLKRLLISDILARFAEGMPAAPPHPSTCHSERSEESQPPRHSQPLRISNFQSPISSPSSRPAAAPRPAGPETHSEVPRHARQYQQRPPELRRAAVRPPPHHRKLLQRRPTKPEFATG